MQRKKSGAGNKAARGLSRRDFLRLGAAGAAAGLAGWRTSAWAGKSRIPAVGVDQIAPEKGGM